MSIKFWENPEKPIKLVEYISWNACLTGRYDGAFKIQFNSFFFIKNFPEGTKILPVDRSTTAIHHICCD